MALACIRMSDEFGGLPTVAPIAPTITPQRAFSYRGNGFPSLAATTLLVRTLNDPSLAVVYVVFLSNPTDSPLWKALMPSF